MSEVKVGDSIRVVAVDSPPTDNYEIDDVYTVTNVGAFGVITAEGGRRMFSYEYVLETEANE